MTKRLDDLTPVQVEALERRLRGRQEHRDHDRWYEIKDRLPSPRSVVDLAVRKVKVLERLTPGEVVDESASTGPKIPVRRPRGLEDLMLLAAEAMHPLRLLRFFNYELRDKVEEVRRKVKEDSGGLGIPAGIGERVEALMIYQALKDGPRPVEELLDKLEAEAGEPIDRQQVTWWLAILSGQSPLAREAVLEPEVLLDVWEEGGDTWVGLRRVFEEEL